MIKQRIIQLYCNKDARTLASNFASLTVLRLIGYIFPLITLPYLSRIIGPNGFGEIAFAAAILVYFDTFTNFGFDYTATRDIARKRDDTYAVSKIFSNVFFTKILLMFISMVILAICIYTIPFLYERRILLWLTFLYIPGSVIFPEWFFQAEEKMVYITILNFISKLLFTLLVFFVIKGPEDYVYQPLLIACGYWISGIVAMIFIHRKFKVKLLFPSQKEIFETIKGSWYMFISLFLPNLYSNFSTILLRVFGGSVATGVYSGGNRFIDLSDQLSQVLSRTFYPFLARRIDKHRLYVIISGSISVFMSIFLFVSANILIDIFYTPEFSESVKVIRIMSIAPIALFLMNTYGPNYLVLQGKEKLYSRIILVYSIFGFILTSFITVRYSYIGMSITMVTIWLLRGLTTMYFANKHMKILKK